jgi:hypothetical protein
MKPPKVAISVPEVNGPTQAIKRGALNTNPAPVARMRVGNSSGSHTAIQVYCPVANHPSPAAATSRRVRSRVNRNRTAPMQRPRQNTASWPAFAPRCQLGLRTGCSRQPRQHCRPCRRSRTIAFRVARHLPRSRRCRAGPGRDAPEAERCRQRHQEGDEGAPTQLGLTSRNSFSTHWRVAVRQNLYFRQPESRPVCAQSCRRAARSHTAPLVAFGPRLGLAGNLALRQLQRSSRTSQGKSGPARWPEAAGSVNTGRMAFMFNLPRSIWEYRDPTPVKARWPI